MQWDKMLLGIGVKLVYGAFNTITIHLLYGMSADVCLHALGSPWNISFLRGTVFFNGFIYCFGQYCVG